MEPSWRVSLRPRTIGARKRHQSLGSNSTQKTSLIYERCLWFICCAPPTSIMDVGLKLGTVSHMCSYKIKKMSRTMSLWIMNSFYIYIINDLELILSCVICLKELLMDQGPRGSLWGHMPGWALGWPMVLEDMRQGGMDSKLSGTNLVGLLRKDNSCNRSRTLLL